MKLHRRQILAAATAAFALSTGGALAQAYPAKPITIVVPYPAGGDTDAMARLYAEKLSSRLKQTVLVDNRPGAGGAVGIVSVGRAPADGYTLLFVPNAFTAIPLVLKLAGTVNYDVLHGFSPIIQTGSQTVLLVSNPRAGINSVQDMLVAAKAGKPMAYASPGAGSPMHIAAELLNRAAGVKIQHVPYRGVAPSVPDVVAGHVPLAYVNLGPVAQYINSGKLIPLAITDDKRSPLLPSTPTMVELGYQDVVSDIWFGFMAPKGTPPAIVKLLNEHLNEILRMPDVVEKMAGVGAIPVGGAPAALERRNASDYERLGKVVKELGITAD